MIVIPFSIFYCIAIGWFFGKLFGNMPVFAWTGGAIGYILFILKLCIKIRKEQKFAGYLITQRKTTVSILAILWQIFSGLGSILIIFIPIVGTDSSYDSSYPYAFTDGIIPEILFITLLILPGVGYSMYSISKIQKNVKSYGINNFQNTSQESKSIRNLFS